MGGEVKVAEAVVLIAIAGVNNPLAVKTKTSKVDMILPREGMRQFMS
jgi:hypothetical protein